jgi:hypothetical protein
MMAKKAATTKSFALDRSNSASAIAYDLCKVTAQSCMLINGGAATAIVAILSKEKIDPILNAAIPYALSGYAIGVLVSAIMLFCIMMMADHWNYFWYFSSYDPDYDVADRSEKYANLWHWGMYTCFALTIACFLFGSGAIAKSLFNSASVTQTNQPLLQKK